ncbi:subtilisin-like protein [Aureobasidium sp. EXF-3400]|nr:subtilisin-like protein [Aureobasidium sp. EXF-12344]KAI4768073.1 subtilisin-like protein [Aureobasidium sp. EXF-3400]
MGVQYVSRSQMFFWSCQHSLCGLESAVFLCKWLQSVAATLHVEPLTAHETTILNWVRSLVKEARESVELEELGITTDSSAFLLQPYQLCTIVLRIWAIVFGGNTMWAIINQIGSGLRNLAERIELEALSSNGRGTQGFQPEIAVSRFGSGAGFCDHFARPSYQSSAVDRYIDDTGDLDAGLYNQTGRDYPDVAAQGNHDVFVWEGDISTVGGTSASAPTFGAVIALVNDALVAAGKSALGFLNPWLYTGAYAALIDITTGSSIGCETTGFPAAVVWDAVTGFGTPNLGKLIAEAFRPHHA